MRARRHIGKFETKDLTPFLIIGGVVVLYPLIKSLVSGATTVTQDFGLSSSPDRLTEDQAYATGYYPLFSNYFDKVQPNAPDGAALFTVADNENLADQLINARGILFETSSQAIAVFQNFTSQFEVSFFAKVFQQYTGNDLFTWMRKDNSLFAQGFAASTMATIINYINSLPKF